MDRRRLTGLVVLAMSLGAAAGLSAQEPASSFAALAGRIHVGERIWVTDLSGREVRGTLETLSDRDLVLNAGGVQRFSAASIRRIRARERDSRKNGTLIGLGAGAGMGAVWCAAASADSGHGNARVECAEGFLVYPALGALVGLALDAATPGALRVVYEAPGRPPASRASFSIAPVVGSGAKALVLSWRF